MNHRIEPTWINVIRYNMGNEPKRRGQDPVTNKKRRNEPIMGLKLYNKQNGNIPRGLAP